MSLVISDVEHVLIYLLAHLYVFFGKISIQVLSPFYNESVLFFEVGLHESFVYFRYQLLITAIICKYLLSFRASLMA